MNSAMSPSIFADPDKDTSPRKAALVMRVLARLGPDYTIFAVFATILVILTIIRPVPFRWRTYTVEMTGAAAILMILIRFIFRAPSILKNQSGVRREFRRSSLATLRDWGPIFLLSLVFANLEVYSTFFRDRVIDDYLYRFDMAVFGCEPTVVLSRLNIPLLTDWMAIAYTSYIVTPVLLSAFVLLRGRRAEFREMMTAAVLQLYSAFLICLVFPAGPPRYYAALVQGGFDPPALESFFGLYEVQQISFDRMDPLSTRSAFPSLHCALALFTLVYAWRYGDAVFPKHRRLFFYLALPVVVSLWVSVVYLRHHWILDIVAGWLVAWLACYLAPRMRRAWPKVVTAPGATVPQ
jgi:membrane-associated phospholipid phosphatase